MYIECEAISESHSILVEDVVMCSGRGAVSIGIIVGGGRGVPGPCAHWPGMSSRQGVRLRTRRAGTWAIHPIYFLEIKATDSRELSVRHSTSGTGLFRHAERESGHCIAACS
jgi:hypothetical protein